MSNIENTNDGILADSASELSSANNAAGNLENVENKVTASLFNDPNIVGSKADQSAQGLQSASNNVDAALNGSNLPTEAPVANDFTADFASPLVAPTTPSDVTEPAFAPNITVPSGAVEESAPAIRIAPSMPADGAENTAAGFAPSTNVTPSDATADQGNSPFGAFPTENAGNASEIAGKTATPSDGAPLAATPLFGNITSNGAASPAQPTVPLPTADHSTSSSATFVGAGSDLTENKKTKKEKLPREPKVQKPLTRRALVVTALVTALLTAAFIIFGAQFGLLKITQKIGALADVNALQSQSQIDKALQKESGTAPDWEKIFAAVNSSVVSIQVISSTEQAQGSGFIADTNGHVITNNHVIADASGGQISVTLFDGRLYEAKVLGTDPTSDLAVLQLQNTPDDLKPVEFADSHNVTVGDDVMAVGNPLGLANTATVGIISAVDRPVTTQQSSGKSNSLLQQDNGATLVVTNALQLDAAVNPGNSGGPLFDANGKVVGVTSSIATMSQNTGSIGLGFAIPSSVAQQISQQIIENGKAQHVALGVTITDDVVKQGDVQRRAVKVNQVGDDTPALRAGLQPGDMIIAVDDRPVSSTYSLMGYIREFPLGAKVKLSYIRGAEVLEATLTLDKLQEDALNGLQQPSTEDGGGDDQGDNGELQDPYEQFKKYLEEELQKQLQQQNQP
jgi:putative serine protease PepD